MTWDGTRANTGWTDIPLLEGFTATAGLTPQVCRINGVIYTRGQVTGTFAANTTVNVGTLPSGFRPTDQNVEFATTSNAAEGRVRFTTGGIVDLRFAEAITFGSICAAFPAS